MGRVEAFAALARQRGLDPRGLLGGPGYGLPDLNRLHPVRFEDIAKGADPMVAIDGPFAEGNLLLLPKAGLLKPVKITTRPVTAGCLIVLDADLTLAPAIQVFGLNQTVILSGDLPTGNHSGMLTITAHAERNLLFWGKAATSNGTAIALAGDGQQVLVGDDCMFSNGIAVATHDMHALVDMQTGQQTNIAQDILFEPHVWVGQHATVLPGVVVGLGSVIATRSVVTQSVPRFSVAAGAPARVVRGNTSWDRRIRLQPATVARLRALAAEVSDAG